MNDALRDEEEEHRMLLALAVSGLAVGALARLVGSAFHFALGAYGQPVPALLMLELCGACCLLDPSDVAQRDDSERSHFTSFNALQLLLGCS